MKNWKAILGLILIFASGMAVGGLLTARIIETRIRHFLQSGPDAVAAFVETRLNRDLDLDPAQRQEIARIIARARQTLSETRREAQPKVDEAFKQAEHDIRTLLKPDQIARYDQIVARAKARWKR